MDKLNKAQAILKALESYGSISNEEMAKFIQDIANLFAQYRSATTELNKETKDTLNLIVKQVNKEHDRILVDIETTSSQSKSDVTQAMKDTISQCKVMCDDMVTRMSKLKIDGVDGKNGINGKDADETVIVEKVLKKLPKVKELEPETAESIAKKLNKENGIIDAKVIKGLIEYLNLPSNKAWKGDTSTASGGSTTFIGLTDVPASYTGQGTKFLRVNGAETALEFATVAGGGDALTSAPLSQFAATTSAQLAGVMSDETGTGALVFANSPTLVTPALGTPASGVATNLTGTATALNIGGNAATVTTNANLTGHVTSVGNAAVLGSFTVAQLNTAISDADVATGGGTAIGTNTGDNATNSQYSGLVTNATHTGDATGSGALTVVALNGTSLAGLATGVLKNTTTTGVPFISKVVLTEPATAATITIANNQTLTVNGSATITNGTHSGTNTGDQTNITGNAATVTTNANLTGPITSVGNATSIASQTGTGTKFVVDNSPTLITPVLGVATATSINKVAITVPATSSTLTIADGKTLTASNSVTLTGTDGVSMNVSNNKIAQITMMIGDGVNAISANATSFVVPCTFAGTITAYTIAADAGTCTIKTWKKATGTAIPTVADVISTSGVSLSTGTLVRSTTVSDFTSTTVTANDVFIIQATSVATAKYISFTLEIQKS